MPTALLARFVSLAAALGDASSIIRDGRKIVSPNGIEELLEVPIGGVPQWISIRGRDRKNPVLLMIHGSPASPEMPSSWFFQNGWEDYFTVVHGISAAPARPTTPMTRKSSGRR
jgi:hypothetical protein